MYRLPKTEEKAVASSWQPAVACPSTVPGPPTSREHSSTPAPHSSTSHVWCTPAACSTTPTHARSSPPISSAFKPSDAANSSSAAVACASSRVSISSATGPRMDGDDTVKGIDVGDLTIPKKQWTEAKGSLSESCVGDSFPRGMTSLADPAGSTVGVSTAMAAAAAAAAAAAEGSKVHASTSLVSAHQSPTVARFFSSSALPMSAQGRAPREDADFSSAAQRKAHTDPSFQADATTGPKIGRNRPADDRASSSNTVSGSSDTTPARLAHAAGRSSIRTATSVSPLWTALVRSGRASGSDGEVRISSGASSATRSTSGTSRASRSSTDHDDTLERQPEGATVVRGGVVTAPSDRCLSGGVSHASTTVVSMATAASATSTRVSPPPHRCGAVSDPPIGCGISRADWRTLSANIRGGIAKQSAEVASLRRAVAFAGESRNALLARMDVGIIGRRGVGGAREEVMRRGRGAAAQSMEHPFDVNPAEVAEASQQGRRASRSEHEQRLRLIDEHNVVLEHVVTCKKEICETAKCDRMKVLLEHISTCTLGGVNGGCDLCWRMWALIQLHARKCKNNECAVPYCLRLRQHVRHLHDRQEGAAATVGTKRPATSEADHDEKDHGNDHHDDV